MIGRKPDLMILGGPRSGAGWLIQVLRARKDIWVPPFGSAGFFAHKFGSEDQQSATEVRVLNGLAAAKARHLRNQATPDPDYLDWLDTVGCPPMFNGTWYKRVFSRAYPHQTCLDPAVDATLLGPDAVEFAAKFLKEARVLWATRDPVAQAVSLLQSAPNDPTPEQIDAVVAQVDYATLLPRWQSRFDPLRLMLVPLEDVARDPGPLYYKIERFINLPAVEAWGLDQISNPGPSSDTASSLSQSVKAELTERLAPSRAALQSALAKAR